MFECDLSVLQYGRRLLLFRDLQSSGEFLYATLYNTNAAFLNPKHSMHCIYFTYIGP